MAGSRNPRVEEMEVSRKILIFAGPNGAGKTMLATEYLPHEVECPAFINADSIAAGLSPLEQAPVNFRAGRLLLQTINEHVATGRSFAFETTLSGLGACAVGIRDSENSISPRPWLID